jgi:hypothetical protein
VLLAGGRYAEALPFLATMVDGTCCFFASTLLMRANALGALGRLPEALLDTERAIALRPPTSGSCARRGATGPGCSPGRAST